MSSSEQDLVERWLKENHFNGGLEEIKYLNTKLKGDPQIHLAILKLAQVLHSYPISIKARERYLYGVCLKGSLGGDSCKFAVQSEKDLERYEEYQKNVKKIMALYKIRLPQLCQKVNELQRNFNNLQNDNTDVIIDKSSVLHKGKRLNNEINNYANDYGSRASAMRVILNIVPGSDDYIKYCLSRLEPSKDAIKKITSLTPVQFYKTSTTDIISNVNVKAQAAYKDLTNFRERVLNVENHQLSWLETLLDNSRVSLSLEHVVGFLQRKVDQIVNPYCKVAIDIDKLYESIEKSRYLIETLICSFESRTQDLYNRMSWKDEAPKESEEPVNVSLETINRIFSKWGTTMSSTQATLMLRAMKHDLTKYKSLINMNSQNSMLSNSNIEKMKRYIDGMQFEKKPVEASLKLLCESRDILKSVRSLERSILVLLEKSPGIVINDQPIDQLIKEMKSLVSTLIYLNTLDI